MRPPSPSLSLSLGLGMSLGALSRSASLSAKKKKDKDDHSRSSSVSSVSSVSSSPPSPVQKPFSVRALKGIHFNKVLEHVCVYTPEETPLSILLSEKYAVVSSSPSNSATSSPAVSPFGSTNALPPSQLKTSSPNKQQFDSNDQMFNVVEKPPILPQTSPATSPRSMSRQHHNNNQHLPPRNASTANPLQVWSILSKTTPSPFTQQILGPCANIALESICVSQSASSPVRASLLLTVLVRNLHFVKKVQCVYTTDAWQTVMWTEIGIFVTALDGVDRFRVEMGIPSNDQTNTQTCGNGDAMNIDETSPLDTQPPRNGLQSLNLQQPASTGRQHVVTVEFAVKCLMGSGDGCWEVWDNRNKLNHVVVLERSSSITTTNMTPQKLHHGSQTSNSSTYTIFNTVGNCYQQQHHQTPDSAVDIDSPTHFSSTPTLSSLASQTGNSNQRSHQNHHQHHFHQYNHSYQQIDDHQQQTSAAAKRRAAAVAARTAQAMALEAQQIEQEFTRRRKMSLEASAAVASESHTSQESPRNASSPYHGSNTGGGFKIADMSTTMLSVLSPTGGIISPGGSSPRSVVLRKPIGSALLYAQSPTSSLEAIITKQQQVLHGVGTAGIIGTDNDKMTGDLL
ncbi:hypothetical protein BDR26DRAFT_860988 [Obelidium mucronatum]|nr:hypothetical protein BDR26DRAFT_860988 [Obelidium mucronatum]